MIPIFLPSKNRACQAQLFIESLKNCPIFHPYVLFKVTDDAFYRGYVKLMDWCVQNNQPITFKEEKNIEKDFRAFLDKWPVFGIATDDTVLYRKHSLTENEVLCLLDEETFCISLRMGLNNTIQNYQTGEKQEEIGTYDLVRIKDNSHLSETFVKWNWKAHGVQANPGYPMGQDFHIFRSQDFKEALNFSFPNMRHVESEMVRNRWNIKKEYMVAPKHSIAVNIPANNCQEPFITNGFNSHSTEELNERYLNGETIDLDKMDFSDIKGAHQPIKYEFKHA